MTRLTWAIGYSHEAKAHRLAWPTREGDDDAKTTPAVCGCKVPFGWLMLFPGQPDARVFPACRVCVNRIRR